MVRKIKPLNHLEETRNEIMSGCFWQKPDGEEFTQDEIMTIIKM